MLHGKDYILTLIHNKIRAIWLDWLSEPHDILRAFDARIP